MKMSRLFSQIVAATLGLWLATLFVPEISVNAYPTSNIFGFNLQEKWEIFLVLGVALGLLNYFLKPLLKTLSLPLEIITLGLFTIVIDAVLIWLIDIMFDELSVPLFWPLIYVTLIIWGTGIIIGFFTNKHK